MKNTGNNSGQSGSSKEWSTTSDGSERVTITKDNGSSRDVTKESNGKLTVTDHRPDGTSVTGDGHRWSDLLVDLDKTSRVNTR